MSTCEGISVTQPGLTAALAEMLSVEYHAAFWAISGSAAAIYNIIVSCFPIMETVFQALLGPLTTYALFSISNEPSPTSLYKHQFRIGCLLVSLGSVTGFFHVPDSDADADAVGLGWLVHTLLACMVSGTLEAIRQDVRPTHQKRAGTGPGANQLTRCRIERLSQDPST